MNKELATVFKNKLVDLPFVDMIAGMVQTVTMQRPSDDNGNAPLMKFPVSYDTPAIDSDCYPERERDLIPNSSRKSITYFEDYGTTVVEVKGGVPLYKSRLRLVSWLNRALLVGDAYKEISGVCIAQIVQRICYKNPKSIGIFQRLIVHVAGIQPQDAAIFGKYTYDEVKRQYLRPPFEYFAIDLEATYNVIPNCLEPIPWDKTTCV